jgi:hypothetical protein
MLMGKTLAGLRAQDIAQAVRLLGARADVDAGRIALIGVGRAAVPALYATAFDSRIASLEVAGMVPSYLSILESRIHRQVFEHVVPGAIRFYDLPDVVRAIAPRKVTVLSE